MTIDSTLPDPEDQEVCAISVNPSEYAAMTELIAGAEDSVWTILVIAGQLVPSGQIRCSCSDGTSVWLDWARTS